MEEIKAKWVFEQGGFAKAVIAPTPMGAGYHLHLVKFGRNAETEVLERRTDAEGRLMVVVRIAPEKEPRLLNRCPDARAIR